MSLITKRYCHDILRKVNNSMGLLYVFMLFSTLHTELVVKFDVGLQKLFGENVCCMTRDYVVKGFGKRVFHFVFTVCLQG